MLIWKYQYNINNNKINRKIRNYYYFFFVFCFLCVLGLEVLEEPNPKLYPSLDLGSYWGNTIQHLLGFEILNYKIRLIAK